MGGGNFYSAPLFFRPQGFPRISKPGHTPKILLGVRKCLEILGNPWKCKKVPTLLTAQKLFDEVPPPPKKYFLFCIPRPRTAAHLKEKETSRTPRKPKREDYPLSSRSKGIFEEGWKFLIHPHFCQFEGFPRISEDFQEFPNFP